MVRFFLRNSEIHCSFEDPKKVEVADDVRTADCPDKAVEARNGFTHANVGNEG